MGGAPVMSEDERFPGEPVVDMDALTFGPPPSEAEAAELLAGLPPVPADPDEIMVVFPVRLPPSVREKLKARAASEGVAMSVLVRQWIEEKLLDPPKLISVDYLMRALRSAPRSDAA